MYVYIIHISQLLVYNVTHCSHENLSSLLLTSNPIGNQTLSLLGHTCLHCVSAHLYIYIQIINKCMIFHLCTHHHTCVKCIHCVFNLSTWTFWAHNFVTIIFMLDSIHLWLVYIIVVNLIQWMMLCWNYHEFVISALILMNVPGLYTRTAKTALWHFMMCRVFPRKHMLRT